MMDRFDRYGMIWTWTWIKRWIEKDRETEREGDRHRDTVQRYRDTDRERESDPDGSIQLNLSFFLSLYVQICGHAFKLHAATFSIAHDT